MDGQSSVEVKVAAAPTSLAPSWPMPLAGVQARTVELEVGADGSLTIGPAKGSLTRGILPGLAILIPGLAGVGMALELIRLDAKDWVGLTIWAVGAIVILGLCVLFFLGWSSSGNWVRFDRSAGRIDFLRRPFGFRRTPRVYRSLPMADVACLQLIYNGFHSSTEEIGAGEQKSFQTVQFYSYQMNLVQAGKGQERVNLAHHSDWEWMRRVGTRLAEYVGVPVSDQLYHGQ